MSRSTDPAGTVPLRIDKAPGIVAPDARRSLALRNVFTTSSKRQCGTLS